MYGHVEVRGETRYPPWEEMDSSARAKCFKDRFGESISDLEAGAPGPNEISPPR